MIATQSSLADGTDPLPKAELEQFAVMVPSDRPTSDEELQVVRTERDFEDGIAPVTDRESLLRMIEAVRGIYVDKSVEHYIKDIVLGIRRHPDLKLHAVPKASLSFLAIARARAAVRGRDYVIPDDVKDIAHAVLAHRLVLSEKAEMEGVTTAGIIDGVLASAQGIHYSR